MPVTQVEQLRRVVVTLISWMAQSANSPISRAEAKQLLDLLAEIKDQAAGVPREAPHD